MNSDPGIEVDNERGRPSDRNRSGNERPDSNRFLSELDPVGEPKGRASNNPQAKSHPTLEPDDPEGDGETKAQGREEETHVEGRQRGERDDNTPREEEAERDV